MIVYKEVISKMKYLMLLSMYIGKQIESISLYMVFNMIYVNLWPLVKISEMVLKEIQLRILGLKTRISMIFKMFIPKFLVNLVLWQPSRSRSRPQLLEGCWALWAEAVQGSGILVKDLIQSILILFILELRKIRQVKRTKFQNWQIRITNRQVRLMHQMKSNCQLMKVQKPQMKNLKQAKMKNQINLVVSKS